MNGSYMTDRRFSWSQILNSWSKKRNAEKKKGTPGGKMKKIRWWLQCMSCAVTTCEGMAAQMSELGCVWTATTTGHQNRTSIKRIHKGHIDRWAGPRSILLFREEYALLNAPYGSVQNPHRYTYTWNVSLIKMFQASQIQPREGAFSKPTAPHSLLTLTLHRDAVLSPSSFSENYLRLLQNYSDKFRTLLRCSFWEIMSSCLIRILS